MRFKHKKLFISGTAVAAAGALGAGALFQTVLSVQASSEMMPVQKADRQRKYRRKTISYPGAGK